MNKSFQKDLENRHHLDQKRAVSQKVASSREKTVEVKSGSAEVELY